MVESTGKPMHRSVWRVTILLQLVRAGLATGPQPLNPKPAIHPAADHPSLPQHHARLD